MLSWLKLELLGIFAYLEWSVIEVALGKAQGLGWIFLPLSLVTVFGTLGFYIARMVKNK